MEGDTEDMLGAGSTTPGHVIETHDIDEEQGISALLVGDEPLILITFLPEVVLVKIMQYLCLKDQYHLSVTCKLFHSLFSHPQLWLVGHIRLPPANNYMTSPKTSEIVIRFSHMFKHLILDMYDRIVPFDDVCRKMLENFNKECYLQSLSLRFGTVSSKNENSPRSGTGNSNFSDLPLVVGLVKKAVCLRRLNIISWPLPLEPDDNCDIFKALLANEKLKNLESLRIFYVDANSEVWVDNGVNLPSVDVVLQLVSHFKNLAHLALRSSMLSHEILIELASNKLSHLRLFQVIIVPARSVDRLDIPNISPATWRVLRKSSPELKIEFSTFFTITVKLLNAIMNPEIALSSFTIAKYCRCDSELIENLIEQYKNSLEKFVSFCECAPCDGSLINLVRSCRHLNHLQYHGHIHYKTIIAMAEIIKQNGRTFSYFEFDQRFINTLNDTFDEDAVIVRDFEFGDYYQVGLQSWHRDEMRHRNTLAELAVKVSSILGYHWQLVSFP